MIFESKSGRRVEIVHDTPIKYFDEGGGFVHELPASEFFAYYRTASDAPRPYRAVLINFDGGPDYAAYSRGDRWNGWSMPYFTHSEVVRLAADLHPRTELVYHPEDNTWRNDQQGDGEEDVYIEETIEVDGQRIKVFGIGAGSWCWDETEGETT